MISELNQEVERQRHERSRLAEQRHNRERNREIMNNVLANLGKKDSLKKLMEDYEGSLHHADKVNESPRRNNEEMLINPKDIDNDQDFSRKLIERDGSCQAISQQKNNTS